MNVLRIYSNERRRTIPFFRYLLQSPYEGVFREYNRANEEKFHHSFALFGGMRVRFPSQKAAADSTSAAAIVIPLHKAPSATKRTFSLNRVQKGTCPSYAEARKGARKCTETLPRGKERLIVFLLRLLIIADNRALAADDAPMRKRCGREPLARPESPRTTV